ncbi:MAG: hypothetical protein LUG26_01545 [Ruminococcus sp.]|nr:hypothetical protein [Ruminococcus sp.]
MLVMLLRFMVRIGSIRQKVTVLLLNVQIICMINLAVMIAHIVGDDNAKFGADRLVDGVQIQSKYCRTGSKRIAECFENGRMKYTINGGTEPMQIEVPSDMYDSAVQAMESRIRRGEVPRVTDPLEAKNIVRKGHFTYKQAMNIAKAGTVESLTYDAVNGSIVSSYAFGITSLLTFTTSLWNGDDFDEALKKSALSGIKVGGTSFAVAVLSSQLSKAGLNSLLVGSSEAIVNVIGSKASATLVNAFRSGTNIYCTAAMKSAAKMLRGNVITGTISVAVLSSADVVNIFRGRISGKQLFKNLTTTTATVAGGTAGWVGGATIGTALFPGVGSVIGGLIGSMLAGSASGKVSKRIMDCFVEDDAEKMIKIIENIFHDMAVEYLLNKDECERITEKLGKKLTGKILKDMFASNSKGNFARNLLTDIIEEETKSREYIHLPTKDKMVKSLKLALESI